MNKMNNKFLISGLIVSSFIGYLEWGKDSKAFLVQGEIEVLSKLFTVPSSAIHPFTLVPLLGQAILLFTLFQKKPNRKLVFIGLGCIGFLMLFMLFIGIISLKYKIIFSTMPFLFLGIITIKMKW